MADDDSGALTVSVMLLYCGSLIINAGVILDVIASVSVRKGIAGTSTSNFNPHIIALSIGTPIR